MILASSVFRLRCIFILCIGLIVLIPNSSHSQSIEKISFDLSDSSNGHYLAIRPPGKIRAVLVFFGFYRPPENIPAETKLHNVAFANDILTIYASTGKSVVADEVTLNRIDAILRHITQKFPVDTATFVLGGYEIPGNIIIRYTELTREHPGRFAISPKAVFAVDCFVDLFGLWHWSERQIKKNSFPGAVGDAHFFLDQLKQGHATLEEVSGQLKEQTSFNRELDVPGNERFLQSIPLRLYYDVDVPWQIQNRGNSLFDTNIPDGSEMINRLQLAGDKEAEFVQSRQPGFRTNGIRNPSALSIVDEIDCIQWIIQKLNIFLPSNPAAWKAPYNFPIPDGWRLERTELPPAFSPKVPYKGFEEMHFPPGWGDPKAEDYFTVSFLFRLNGKPNVDALMWENFLRVYFEGLIADNVPRMHIPKEKLIPVIPKLEKVSTENGDLETYTGTIHALDYQAQVPIVFNLRIHVKPSSNNSSMILMGMSPKKFGHPIWAKIEESNKQFHQ